MGPEWSQGPHSREAGGAPTERPSSGWARGRLYSSWESKGMASSSVPQGTDHGDLLEPR